MHRAPYLALKDMLSETGYPVFPSARVTEQDELIREEYWLLTPPVGADREPERYSATYSPTGPVDYDIDVKAVGRTDEVVLVMIDKLRAFVGSSVEVAGRVSSPLRLEAGPVSLDRTVKPGLWFCDLGLLFTSREGT